MTNLALFIMYIMCTECINIFTSTEWVRVIRKVTQKDLLCKITIKIRVVSYYVFLFKSILPNGTSAENDESEEHGLRE